MPTVETVSFGPWSLGVVDTADPAQPLTGALRKARNVQFSGASRLAPRGGTTVQMSLVDDQGSPAAVTSVCGLWPFADRAIAIAHSTVTSKVYLYLLTPAIDGWYDSGLVLHASNATAQPYGALWTSVTTAPDVLLAEGLGTCYIAHTGAADKNGLYFPTKQFDGTTISSLLANGTGGTAGTDVAYFLGVISFKQALWGWGYGSSNVASSGYRPELLRFSQPNFQPLQAVDSFAVGDRVRSIREAVVAAGLAGESLIVGAPFMISRITGFGRTSWYKEPVDRVHGITGPKAVVWDMDSCYFWSYKGPMRIAQSGPTQPLWQPIQAFVNSVINPEKVIAFRDEIHDVIGFLCDTGAGTRVACSYDTLRNVWLGPDDDLGEVFRAFGEVDPVPASATAAAPGPTGAPTSPVTSAVGATTATAAWTAGDLGAQTEVSIQRTVDTAWTVVTTLAAGVQEYVFTALNPSTAYQWRVRHVKNGQFSSYLGPVAATQFTTTTSSSPGALQPPSNLQLTGILGGGFEDIYAMWTNSGESGVSTEVWAMGPNDLLFTLRQTVAPGVSSAGPFHATVGGTWTFQVRHVKPGSTASAFAPSASIVVHL